MEDNTMIYKAIPGPRVVTIKEGEYQQATDLFADIMNSMARDGWTYHSMEVVTTSAKTGCMLNPQVVETNLYMLIFCKEK